ncbi:Gp19/Gp15/Gp42 family protein [Leucobacter sp. NPDC058333]|uniref:Gp19/Gp15/Gp42 family protein n=1 Tax=Leucobacter sp. NPDC058333 TaxID=3346450 RepID=UPI00365B8C85
MADPLATKADVEASLLRSLSTAEGEFLPKLLERAEQMLIGYVPDLLTRAAEGTWLRGVVIRIEADMVARVLRNPEGMRQESDGVYSYSVDWAVASGRLKPLDDELLMLGVRVGLSSAAGEMDGYARRRYGVDPANQFQIGWPACDSMSEPLGWGGF